MGYCMKMESHEFYVPAKFASLVFVKTKEEMYDFDWDNDGNIVGISFRGDKLGEEFRVFQSIAPYVKEGSYLHMIGEDGDQWRWVFRNGTCEEIHAKVTWSSE